VVKWFEKHISDKINKLETKASSHEGQCIPAGYNVSLPRRVLITVSIITTCCISRKLCVRLFMLCKISTWILRLLWHHLQTDSFLKLVRNWPQNAVLNLALSCGAIWRHGEKSQHRCTTTVHPAYNGSKKILENLLPVGLLVHTNLFIPSRFWTTYTKFDNCCLRYIATCGNFLYRCTSTFSALNYCGRFSSYLSAIYTANFWTFRNFWRQFRENCGATWRRKWEPCSAPNRAIPSEKSAEHAFKIDP